MLLAGTCTTSVYKQCKVPLFFKKKCLAVPLSAWNPWFPGFSFYWHVPRSLPVNSHPEEALAGSSRSVENLAKSSFLHSRQTFLGQVAKQGREEAKSGLNHNTVDIDLASGTYSYTLNLWPNYISEISYWTSDGNSLLVFFPKFNLRSALKLDSFLPFLFQI